MRRNKIFVEFKVSLRSYEETEQSRSSTGGDSILKSAQGQTFSRSSNNNEQTKGPICYNCHLTGHMAKDCRKPKKLWCSTCCKTNHTDKTCRRNKKSSDQVNEVGDLFCEDEHSFAFKTNASDDKILGRGNTLLVDCGATTHIINDETMFSKFDTSFQPEKHFNELADGRKSNNIVLKRGEVDFMIKDTSGRCVKACLKNALFVCTFPQNIFSVQAATERGASVHFKPESAELVYKDGTMFGIQKCGKLYYLHTCDMDNGQTDESVNYACDLKG